jgi:hypothetical protein
MKALVGLVAVLVSTAALAQTTAPPMVGDKPLVQVKPKAASAEKAAPKAPGKPQSIAARLQTCLEIEDGTKGRLDCYDTVFPPKPANPKKGKPPPAKGVADCRVVAEQDERLACYNGFAESIPKLPKS